MPQDLLLTGTEIWKSRKKKNLICTSWDVLLSQKKSAEAMIIPSVQCPVIFSLGWDLLQLYKKILLFCLHKTKQIYTSRISTNWTQALPDTTIHSSPVQIMRLQCVSAGGARTVHYFKSYYKLWSFMYTCCLVNHQFISETCILEVRSTLGGKGGEIQFYEEIKKEVYGILPLYFLLQMFQCLQEFKALSVFSFLLSCGDYL